MTDEQFITREARARGFAVQKMPAGHYVITDKLGHGIVRATPATLEGVVTFLTEQVDRVVVNVGHGTHTVIPAGEA